MTARLSTLAASAALLLACTSDATQILLRIHSDLAPGPELARVVVRVRREGASEGYVQRFDVGTGGRSLPGEIAINPTDPHDARPLRVEVIGERDALPPIGQQALVRFQTGAVTVLHVVLASRCATETGCSISETCGWAGCQPIDRGPLPELNTSEGQDAGCTLCDERCTDTSTSRAHCGGCNAPCPGSVACVNSRCDCARSSVCDGRCVDLMTSSANCGVCGTSCTSACHAGRCVSASFVAVGASSACAVMSDASVTCWGANNQGQAGFGATEVARPQTVVPATQNARLRSLSVGATHACAVVNYGVVCWGSDATGELGDGLGARMSSAPQSVSILGASSFAEEVAAGVGFSCVQQGGGVYCWGTNDQGQLGFEGEMGAIHRPLRVGLPTDVPVVHIAAGARHVCALTEDGAVWCWGANDNGQCSGAGEGPVTSPRRVEGLAPARELALGESHSCAVAGRGVYCWGDNTYGQLGFGIATRVERPSRAGSFDAVHVAAGASHTCALTSTALLWCWGANTRGQCARSPSSSSIRTPSMGELVATSEAVQISAGGASTCVTLATGAVVCWGDNGRHQLGRDSGSPAAAPVAW